MNYKVLGSVQELLTLLNEGKNIVLMASTTTCPPCKMFTNILEEVSGFSVYSEISFAKINLDDHPSANDIVGVTSVPTILFMKGPEEVRREVGAMTKDKFINLINSVFS